LKALAFILEKQTSKTTIKPKENNNQIITNKTSKIQSITTYHKTNNETLFCFCYVVICSFFVTRLSLCQFIFCHSPVFNKKIIQNSVKIVLNNAVLY